MCGRFTQHFTWAEVRDFLDVLGTPRNVQPRYNIAPTDTIDVAAIGKDGDRKLVPMRWGLIPVWWKKPLKELPATFNARREGVADKPMFRDAYRSRRCIVPMSGFYEWIATPEGKQPFFVSGAEQPVLGVAGLWDRWRDPAGEWVVSATMVVEPANDFMGRIHTRMPVFIDRADIGGWLSGDLGLDALKPTSEELLLARPVSKRVNRVGSTDDPSLVEAVSAEVVLS